MRLSSIALLVLGASAIVCNPAGAWESRTLLNSELATGVTNAAGSGSGSGGASLNIGSFTSSGALNTGSLKESYSTADSYVAVEADETDTNSESYADADVFQNDAALPQALGSVSSGATAAGSEFSGTGATAMVGVEEVYDQFGSGGSFGVSTAFGDSNSVAAGLGSTVVSFVEAEGEAYNGEVDGKDIALSGGSASGHTSGEAQGDYVAITESQISLATASEVDPNAYDRENGYHSSGGGVAIIDAWSSAYGEESASATETELEADAWANTADYTTVGYDAAVVDATAGAEADYSDSSAGYGPGLSESGGSGILDVGVLVTGGAFDTPSSEGPVAVGVGTTEAFVHAGGETYAVGKNTYSTGDLSGYTAVDTGVTAVGSGQYSQTEDANPAAASSFHGVGTSTGTNGEDAEITIGALSFSEGFEVATSTGFSQSITDASAEAEVLSAGEDTLSEAMAGSVVNSNTGGVTNNELSGTGGRSDFVAAGTAEAEGATNSEEENPGYSEAGAGTEAKAESLTITGDNEFYTGGSSTAESGGVASGNEASLDLIYGNEGESNAIAHSLDEGGLSATTTRGGVEQEMRVVTMTEDGLTLGLGKSTVVDESTAGSSSGADYSQADSESFATADSEGTFYGDEVAGEGTLSSFSGSNTVVGSGAGDEEEEGYAMTAFATALGIGSGLGRASYEDISFEYAAAGSNPGLVDVNFDGGSDAGSGAVATSAAGFDMSLVEASNYIAADGYGSGYGDFGVEFTAGTIVGGDTTDEAFTQGLGMARVGSGSIGLDMNGLVTVTGLQATESNGEGGGTAYGQVDANAEHSGYGKGAYGISGYGSGAGSADASGVVLGGAAGEDSLIVSHGSGNSDGSSAGGIFSEGADGTLTSVTTSDAGVMGGAGIGSVGNNPEDMIDSMAAAVAFDSSSAVNTMAQAMESEGGEAFAVSGTESAASGDGLIIDTPADDAPTQVLDEAENYAFSDGGALSSGTTNTVSGGTVSSSESAVLEAGDETEFVQLEMVDEDNTALTGSFSGPESVVLEADWEAEGMVESPSAGIAQADVEAGAVGLATGIATAFGTDYNPSTGENPEVSGAFGGGTAYEFTLANARGTAVNVPGKDIQYEDSSGVALSSGSTPTLGLTVGAGEVDIMNDVSGSVGAHVATKAEDGNTLADVLGSAYVMGDIVIDVEAAGENAGEVLAFDTGVTSEETAVVNSVAEETHGEEEVCDDIPPPTSPYTCQEQSGWGKCNKNWMSGYCNASCGRCSYG